MRREFEPTAKRELPKGASVSPLVTPYDTPVLIGDAVTIILSQSAAYSMGPDGRAEQYLTTVGNPAAFHVVDAVTGKVIFSRQLPYPDTIWAMAEASDGNVYFAGAAKGELFCYYVKEKRLESLGLNPSDAAVFDLKATSDGRLYGCTFANNGRFGRVFEYDIVSATFRDHGVMKDGQQYVRGLGVTDDYIYAGIGTTAHLMRYNRHTGEIVEIEIPGVTGRTGTLSEVVTAGGKLLVNGGAKLHVLDESSHALLTSIDFQAKTSPPCPYDPNLIYYKLKGDLYTFHLQTLTTVKVEGIPQLPDDTAVKAFAWITPTEGRFAGQTVLAGMAAFAESFMYDPLTNGYEVHQAHVPASPTTPNALEAKAGYIYIGGYQRGMSIYDTRTERFLYHNPAFHQPEGIGFFGEIVYFGTYTGAKLYRLDMTQQLVYSEREWANPGLAAVLGDYQDRPFAITSGGGKLLIGTVPKYGMLGGALTVLEEQQAPDGTVTGVTSTVYRNIVPNQSIIGLAYKDGKVFAGSSRVGGLGIDPTEHEAKLVAFDLDARQVTIAPFTPSFPGVGGPINLIGGLSIGPDGYLWGVADSTVYQPDQTTVDHYEAVLFALNPASEGLQIVKSRIITQSSPNTSKFRPYYLRWGQDGLLYTTIGRRLFAVDPHDLRSCRLLEDTVNLMTLGPDGSIYYTVGSKLYKMPVKTTRA